MNPSIRILKSLGPALLAGAIAAGCTTTAPSAKPQAAAPEKASNAPPAQASAPTAAKPKVTLDAVFESVEMAPVKLETKAWTDLTVIEAVAHGARVKKGDVLVKLNVQVLDIGIGANCIYPILGNSVYGWSFVGTEIDEKAIQNCKKIIEDNPRLMDFVSLQLQTESRFIFKNIITPEDRFSLTICNPPFHNSQEEATKSSIRKVNNLENTRTTKPVLNFGGQNAELWCEGGELGFITQMIFESAKYPMQCLWFTTLVSKKENLSSLYKTLNKVNVVEVKTIDMAQGQKTSRILAWTFQSEAQQRNWKFE